MDKTLITMSGKIGSGKMYQIQKIIEKVKSDGHSVVMISYADDVKKICTDLLGYSKNEAQVLKHLSPFKSKYSFFNCLMRGFETYTVARKVEGLEDFISKIASICANEIDFLFEQQLNIVNGNRSMIYRHFMQYVGTDIGQKIHKSIWSLGTLQKAKKYFESGFDYVFIDDLRFFHEYADAITESTKEDRKFKFLPYCVTASDEARMFRRNLTREELRRLDSHFSESGISDVENQIRKHFGEDHIIKSDETDIKGVTQR